MGALRTFGWHLADFVIARRTRRQSRRLALQASVQSERRTGKVLACCDPAGAEFYDEWLPFATSCCLCNEEILPGDSVTLRNINEHDLCEKATLVGTDHAVGCLRAGCGPYAHSADGFWTKHGYCPSGKYMGVDTPAQV